MNSLDNLKNLRKRHFYILVLLFVLFVVGMFFINVKILDHSPIYNPIVIHILKYISIFVSGIFIYIGYNKYSKTIDLYKKNDDVDLKREKYIESNKFQNNLSFIAFALNIILMILSFDNIFLFLATICLIFNCIYIPSEEKFTSDFVEIIDEERYETEINKQDENNINQNFES
ncbi:MAG: hypothetical protein MJ211_06640 [Bacteroidales bacterium]|nr:hypothetical protein [Bacteroidales bacterium]